jgi:uncharacterized heparinase superfamily protein
LSRLGRLATVLRTVRYIRLRQGAAQLHHALSGLRPPARIDEPPPELRARRVAVPFLPPPAHVRVEAPGRLELLNREVELGEPIDWDLEGEGPLWSYHLHELDHARASALSPEVRGRMLLDWIAHHPRGIGWDPHPISLRTLAWAKLLLTPDALALERDDETRVRHSMAEQLETLDRNLEVRLQANHLLSNLIGVVFGGLLFEGTRADAWLDRQRELIAELRDQIRPDGGHEERSPMYHSLLLESLLDLRNLAGAVPGRASEALVGELEATTARMLGALRLWTHPDGQIALFADSAFGIAQTPAALEAYASALGVEGAPAPADGLLRDVGYARLHSEPFTLIASLAGPMPSHQPGHAHCDALSFELSCGDERVVCDTGVCEYVPGTRREQSRATQSHATVEVAGRDQAETWSSHRVGGRPRVKLEAAVGSGRVEASCASWSTRDTVHRRVFHVAEGGVEISDAIEGRARPVRLALPLGVGVKTTLRAGQGDAPTAELLLPSGRRVEVSLPASADWKIERAPYFPEFGRSLERDCLIGRADALGAATWRFRVIDA